jgi:hypothetical protein
LSSSNWSVRSQCSTRYDTRLSKGMPFRFEYRYLSASLFSHGFVLNRRHGGREIP